jgi:hypothetical protein
MAGVGPKWSHIMAHALALDPRTWAIENIPGFGVDRRGRRSSKGGRCMWHPSPRINRIDKDTHTNKLQLLFWKPVTENSKVMRTLPRAMGDQMGSPSRVRMSEDNVCRNVMCWCVGIFLGS